MLNVDELPEPPWGNRPTPWIGHAFVEPLHRTVQVLRPDHFEDKDGSYQAVRIYAYHIERFMEEEGYPLRPSRKKERP